MVGAQVVTTVLELMTTVCFEENTATRVCCSFAWTTVTDWRHVVDSTVRVSAFDYSVLLMHALRTDMPGMKSDFRRGGKASTEMATGGRGGKGDENDRSGCDGWEFQGGAGANEYGGGGGGGFYGGGGGGFTNGTYGGGGAGSTFAIDGATDVRRLSELKVPTWVPILVDDQFWMLRCTCVVRVF